MYLVAQRVITSGGTGINAYRHDHGEVQDWTWSPPDGVPDLNPGTIVRQNVSVGGLGRIASFLDIAAPDRTAVEEIRWSHEAVGALMRVGGRLPLQIVSGPLLIRFELDFQLQQRWHEELHALLNATLTLLELPGTTAVPR